MPKLLIRLHARLRLMCDFMEIKYISQMPQGRLPKYWEILRKAHYDKWLEILFDYEKDGITAHDIAVFMRASPLCRGKYEVHERGQYIYIKRLHFKK